ncbi:MAG: hypothetical protein Q4F05_08700 [bacterium]|nr:hypothetical protein [bacterium]
MSKEMIEILDDLVLEEASTLTHEVETMITIDEEKKVRIKNMAFKKQGLPTEKVVKIHNKKGHKVWMKIAACLTGVCLIGSGTVYASDMLEGLSEYFTGKVNDYKDKISDTIQSASNKECQINLKGAVLDENLFQFVYSVEGVNEKGKEYVSEVLGTNNIFSPDEIYATLKDHTKKKAELYSISKWSGDLVENPDNNMSGVVAVMTDCLGIESMNEVEYFEIYDEGMKLTVNAVMTGETIPLMPDKKTDIKDVKISPIGFAFTAKKVIIDEDKEDELITGHKIRYIKKDGTLEEPNNESYNTWNLGDREHIVADFCMNIHDLDEYKGIQIDGVNFYK